MIAITFITACGSAQAFDLAGFKSVKFGMDRMAVENAGYKCKVDAEQRVECEGVETLFGARANARVWFRGEKVSQIRVIVIDSRPVNLVGGFTKALGKPQKYVERRGRNDLSVHYWLAKNGAAVSTFGTSDTLVAKDPDTGEEHHFATADYLDKEGAARLVADAKKADQLKRDF